MMRRWIAGLAAFVIIATIVQPAAAAAAAEEPCSDYQIIGARGTNQVFEEETAGMGREAFQFARQMKALIQSADPGSSVEYSGVDYPAAFNTQQQYANPYVGVRDKAYYPYYTSAATGGLIVRMMIIDTIERCGTATQIILAGFSQGADVVRRGITELANNGGPGDVDELGQIVGVAAMGDPYFSPSDEAPAVGSYDPARAGMFNGLGSLHFEWDDHIDVPTVSMCREGDWFCQNQKVYGNREASIVDWGPMIIWAHEHWGFDPADLLDPVNMELLYNEHNAYYDNKDGEKVAFLLADRMGINYGAGFKGGDDKPTGVVIVVDSTAGASGPVYELKERAAEFVNLVADNISDFRIAVVDYKGGGAPNVDHATGVHTLSSFSGVIPQFLSHCSVHLRPSHTRKHPRHAVRE